MRFRKLLILPFLLIMALLVYAIVFRPANSGSNEVGIASVENTVIPTRKAIPTSPVTAEPKQANTPIASSVVQTPANVDDRESLIDTMSFVDAQHGWVLQLKCSQDSQCPGYIHATTDGGQTWPLTWPAPVSEDAAVRFFTTQDGWLFNMNGWFSTHDGGATWNAEPDKGGVLSMESIGGSLWAVQQQCAAEPNYYCPLRLLTSADMGRSWVPAKTQPTLQGVGGFEVLDSQNAWIIADLDPGQTDVGKLLASHDGGQTWQDRAYPCQSGYIFPHMAVTKGQLWIACSGDPGAGQADQGKILYRSTDDGKSWQSIAHHTFNTARIGSGPDPEPDDLPQAGLWGIETQSPDKLWMIVADGFLSRSVDGGHTWHYLSDLPYEQVTPGGFGLGPLLFLDENTGWVAGRAGIMRTTDGGEHWEAIPIP